MKISNCSKIVAIGTMVTISLFLANSNNHERANDLTLSNIEALHASAGEMSCDQNNEKECKIVAPSGHTGYSTGKLWATW